MRDHFGHLNGTRNAFNWTQYEYEILGEGSHTLRWAVNHSYYVDDDTKAWVDELEIIKTPIILTQPSPTNVDEGEAIELSIVSNLPSTVTYQWRKDEIPISEATTDSYMINTAASSDTGVYDVIVSNTHGDTISDAVDVFVFSGFGDAIDQPSLDWSTSGIGWSPQTSVSHDGQDALLLDSRDTANPIWFETTVEGPTMISFWWKFQRENGGDQIAFSVDGSSVSSVSSTSDWAEVEYEILQPGSHSIRWQFNPNSGTNKDFNTFGWVDELSISYVPTIIEHPVGSAIDIGDTFVFEVEASAAVELTYQWYHDDLAITGADQSTLTILNALNSDAGNYYVIVSTSARSIQSDSTIVEVLEGFGDAIDQPDRDWVRSLPSWYSQTENTHDGVDALEAIHDGVTSEQWFEFDIEGPFDLSFWWSQSDANSGHAIFFVVDEVGVRQNIQYAPWSQKFYQGLDSRTYTLRWISTANNIDEKSWVDEININQAPIVTEHPQSWYYAEGEDVTFSVEAVSLGAISYQWRKNGENIVGATLSSLSLTNVEQSDIASYDVVLTSSYGEAESETFEILETTEFGEAVEQPSLTWKTNGSEQWLVDSSVTDGSVSSLRSGNISGNENSWLSTVVEGRAELRFNWKASTEACCDRFKFFLDEVEVGEIRGHEDWQEFKLLIPAGFHELKWEYTKDVSTDGGQDTVWIDSVQLVPIVLTQSPDVEIDEGHSLNLEITATAATSPSYQWSKDGENLVGATESTFSIESAHPSDSGAYKVAISTPAGQIVSDPIAVTVSDFGMPIGQPNEDWTFGAEDWSINGDYFERSVVTAEGLAPSEAAWFELSFDGPATISFDWKLATDDGDLLAFFINGVPFDLDLTNLDSWEKFNYVSEENQLHVLRWSYSESASEGGTTDQAWIDNLEIDQMPVIDSQPSTIVFYTGTDVDVTVGVSGRGTFSYQWYLGEVKIVGVNSSTLSLANGSPEDTGEYSLRVFTKHGSVSTMPIELIVSSPLSEGLDQPDFTIEQEKPYLWYSQSEISYDGEDALALTPLGKNESASLSASIDSPFILRFRYRLAEEAETLGITVTVNDQDSFTYGKTGQWYLAEFTYPQSGQNNITISVVNNGELSTDSLIWIDQMEVYSLDEVAVSVASSSLVLGGMSANFSNIGMDQDPESDGMNNFFEYLIGANPYEHDALVSMNVVVQEGLRNYSYSIPVSLDSFENLSFEFQFSADLENWIPISTSSNYADGVLILNAIQAIGEKDENFVRVALRLK